MNKIFRLISELKTEKLLNIRVIKVRTFAVDRRKESTWQRRYKCVCEFVLPRVTSSRQRRAENRKIRLSGVYIKRSFPVLFSFSAPFFSCDCDFLIMSVRRFAKWNDDVTSIRLRGRRRWRIRHLVPDYTQFPLRRALARTCLLVRYD